MLQKHRRGSWPKMLRFPNITWTPRIQNKIGGVWRRKRSSYIGSQGHHPLPLDRLEPYQLKRWGRAKHAGCLASSATLRLGPHPPLARSFVTHVCFICDLFRTSGFHLEWRCTVSGSVEQFVSQRGVWVAMRCSDVSHAFWILSILRQFLGLLGFCFRHHLFLCVFLCFEIFVLICFVIDFCNDLLFKFYALLRKKSIGCWSKNYEPQLGRNLHSCPQKVNLVCWCVIQPFHSLDRWWSSVSVHRLLLL